MLSKCAQRHPNNEQKYNIRNVSVLRYVGLLVLLLIMAQLAGAAPYNESAKLQASDREAGDQFGESVAIDGNRAIVGAPSEDSGGDHAGAAYIFQHSGSGNWDEVARLQASYAGAADYFGHAVDISGSYAIVGANCDDTNGSCAGAAYIYERDGNGAWNEVAKVLASDGEESDLFGWNVAISGERAVIGAFQEDTGGHDAGAAYIFERDNSGNWLEVTKVQAADNEAKDLFGFAVDMSDSRTIISARHDDNAAGAAYIFSDTDASCVAPPTGLISWWPGDGHANDITSSNHGTLHGHTSFAPGMVEQALSLDGYGDFVSIPFNSNYDFAPHEQFTIDAWVKPEPRRSNQAILVKAPVSSDAWDWGVYVDSRNHFMVGLHFQHVLRSTTVVQSGTWYHVAVTYDNASWKLYVNGVLEAEHVGTPITQSTGGLALGRKGESAFHNDFYQGLIDEVELFNRAFNKDEIQALYEAGSAGCGRSCC